MVRKRLKKQSAREAECHPRQGEGARAMVDSARAPFDRAQMAVRQWGRGLKVAECLARRRPCAGRGMVTLINTLHKLLHGAAWVVGPGLTRHARAAWLCPARDLPPAEW